MTNPVRSWGGADAETAADGEAQVTRFLQHRDRCVTAADFATIALRAPSLEIGRVEVLAAYSPELGAAQPGDAAGAVTLMVIPRPDPAKPGPPLPDGPFLDALCHWLEPRRLVTTELFLRGPAYRGIWISVGIEVDPGRSIAEVRANGTAVQLYACNGTNAQRWSNPGDGTLRGTDSSYGAGTYSAETGSFVITLGALPDVGSSIVQHWGVPTQETVQPAADLHDVKLFEWLAWTPFLVAIVVFAYLFHLPFEAHTYRLRRFVKRMLLVPASGRYSSQG